MFNPLWNLKATWKCEKQTLISSNIIWSDCMFIMNFLTNPIVSIISQSISINKWDHLNVMCIFVARCWFDRLEKKWYVIKMLIIWSNHLLFSPCNTSFDEVSNGQTSVKIIDERFWWGEFIEVFNRWYFTTSSPSERIEHQVNRLSFL